LREPTAPRRLGDLESTVVGFAAIPIQAAACIVIERWRCRILQIASHAKGLFDSLIVWHKQSPAVKDPVLIGIKAKPDRSWERETFILARWGEVLEEWPALVKVAMSTWRERTRDALAKLQSEVGNATANIESLGISGAMAFEAPVFR
jgi:hypothetical protein